MLIERTSYELLCTLTTRGSYSQEAFAGLFLFDFDIYLVIIVGITSAIMKETSENLSLVCFVCVSGSNQEVSVGLFLFSSGEKFDMAGIFLFILS